VAAGFDARAFRLPWPEGMRLFELDRPDLLSLKQAALARLHARPHCQRYAVGVDLADQWVPPLIEAGFDPSKPSVWVIEGLLAYLDERAVRFLVERVTGISSSGSRIAVDVPGRAFIDSPWTQPFLQALAHEGAPWKFGTDAPEAMLADYGWLGTAHRPGEEAANYGRWLYPVLPRAMTAVPSSFFVTAVRQSNMDSREDGHGRRLR
jgi:methyltransferase (TIGR00027 family)